ncbi:hypothetical protein M885DRAFT_499315 [Pelagophyceae sp. CCMP2097]|nr:hypothetical protein M885DRAFT_499315 [Pelagophyceae sp. CCMP2097]
MGKKKSSASLGKKAGAAAAAPAAALPAAAAPSVGDPPAEATPAEAVAVAAVASAGLPEEWWTAAQRATIDGVDALFGSPVKDDTSAQLDEGVMKEFDIEIEADDDSELTSDMVSLTPESPGASLKPEAAAPADAAAGAATDAAADQAAFDEEAWAVAASTCASQMQRRARGRAVLSFRKGISCDAFAAGLACGRFAAPASAAELHRRAAISALELDAAVHTRDFSTAAAAQLAVTALRSAAAFALAVGPLLSASLAAEAAAAHLELQFLTGTGSSGRAAKQERPQKDYIRLEILDAKLRAVEAVRRQSCPTRAELVEAVSKAEADLQLSLAKRDFVKCHALELQVGYQIALERAFEQDESLDELVAVSVLAAGMEELKGFLAEALARRDFVTCHGLEARLARKAAVLAEVSLDAEPQVVKARAARATAATTALKKASKRGAAVAAGGGVALHGLAPPEAAADAPPEDAPRIAKDDAPRIAKDDAPRIADASVNSSLPASDDRKKHVKTVAKLRPDAAVIVAPSDTVAKVCVAMAAKRSDCALVVLDGKLVFSRAEDGKPGLRASH